MVDRKRAVLPPTPDHPQTIIESLSLSLTHTLSLALALPWLSVAQPQASDAGPAWVAMPPMPHPRAQAACTAIGPKIYVVGGIDGWGELDRHTESSLRM